MRPADKLCKIPSWRCSVNKKAHDILEKIASGKEFKKYRKEWSETETPFSITSASVFFIHVMLEQGQPTEGRAPAAAKHLVANHFPRNTIWDEIAEKHLGSLRSICKKGFDSSNNATSYSRGYATRFISATFPDDLKKNAEIIVNKYDSDPRNIWKVTPAECELIYTRFKEFYSIGYGLARMAQFLLVRDHGVAGGMRESKGCLKVKPDVHVSRVLYRMGLAKSTEEADIIQCVDEAEVSSQADLDWVLVRVGRDFCKKRQCDKCCLAPYCEKRID